MALGRPQIVTTDNAFTFWGDRPSNTAAIASNRLSRDTRLGRVAVSNAPDADAHRGFGPFPPLVVGEAKRYFGPKVIKPYARNAAQQRLTQRRPKPFYTEAVVVGPGIAFGGPAVLRTRSHAPAPTHSKLRPPLVVIPAVTQTFSGPDTHLAPSRRPVTKSRLGPMGPPALVHAPLSVNLTYSRRGKPLSGLGRPVVLNPNRDFPQGPMVSLAPQRRGKPKSRLRPPVVVGEFVRVVYAPLQTTLAPSSRLGRRARSFYSGPAVLADTRAFGGIGIWLTQPSRRFRLVRSRLRAPVVLRAAAVLAPISVTLAPSHRGRTRSFLKPPTVVRAAQAFTGPQVTLSPSRRGRPMWLLREPTDVSDAADLGEIKVALVRIRPQRTHSRLLPPAVVGPGIFFRPIQTKLVRIRPARTHPQLRPPSIIVHPCFGCVTGYDYGPWATGSDSSNLVTGSDSGALVSGSDSAGTALGAAEPGGNVEGGDARREGC